jgi:L-lactate dehydrogenase complex protein LldG
MNRFSSGDKMILPTNRGVARDEILNNVRDALAPMESRRATCPQFPLPACATGNSHTKLENLLKEIDKLGGTTRIIQTRSVLKSALEELVSTQGIRRATMWATQDLVELNIREMLQGLGISMISPQADKIELAECDLGVTGVDSALPGTGTLLLSASAEHPPVVSMLPRIHLVILDSSALRDNLTQALLEASGKSVVCITGPSRTADIEMTLAIGVHGPRVLIVWALGEDFQQDGLNLYI